MKASDMEHMDKYRMFSLRNFGVR